MQATILTKTMFDLSPLPAGASTGPIQLHVDRSLVGSGPGMLSVHLHAAELTAGARLSVHCRAVPAREDARLYGQSILIADATGVGPVAAPLLLERAVADACCVPPQFSLAVQQGRVPSRLTFTISAWICIDAGLDESTRSTTGRTAPP